MARNRDKRQGTGDKEVLQFCSFAEEKFCSLTRDNFPLRRGQGEDDQNPPPTPASGGNSHLTAYSLVA